MAADASLSPQEREVATGKATALCPTCRASDCSTAKKLSEANPLAFRCYAKVQTRCPLHKQGCAWTGDLGSLHGHLTNSDSHLQKGMSQGDVYDALKKEGDERYRARAYDQAAELYSKAAAVAPERAQAFANRAACRLMAHRYEECVQDCDQALRRDPALANAVALSLAATHLCASCEFQSPGHAGWIWTCASSYLGGSNRIHGHTKQIRRLRASA